MKGKVVARWLRFEDILEETVFVSGRAPLEELVMTAFFVITQSGTGVRVLVARGVVLAAFLMEGRRHALIA